MTDNLQLLAPVQYPGRFNWRYVTCILKIVDNEFSLSQKDGKVLFSYPVSSITQVRKTGSTKLIVTTNDGKQWKLPIGTDTAAASWLLTGESGGSTDVVGLTLGLASTVIEKSDANSTAQTILEPWLAYFQELGVLSEV